MKSRKHLKRKHHKRKHSNKHAKKLSKKQIKHQIKTLKKQCKKAYKDCKLTQKNLKKQLKHTQSGGGFRSAFNGLVNDIGNIPSFLGKMATNTYDAVYDIPIKTSKGLSTISGKFGQNFGPYAYLTHEAVNSVTGHNPSRYADPSVFNQQGFSHESY